MDFTPHFIYLLVLGINVGLLGAKQYAIHYGYKHEWALLSESSGKTRETSKQGVYPNSV